MGRWITKPRPILYWATAAAFGPAFTVVGLIASGSWPRPRSTLEWLDIAIGVTILSLSFLTTAIVFRPVLGRREPWVVVALTLAFPLVSGMTLVALSLLQDAAKWMRAPSVSEVAYSLLIILNASFVTGAMFVIPISFVA